MVIRFGLNAVVNRLLGYTLKLRKSFFGSSNHTIHATELQVHQGLKRIELGIQIADFLTCLWLLDLMSVL